jgi:hypothetical protein
MGLLQNTATLEQLKQYLENTNFGTQQVGHSLTMSFLPPNMLNNGLEDRRYTFNFKHRIVRKEFTKVTYSEVLVSLAIELNNEIKTLLPETVKIYETVGLIENKKCTKELISTVIAGGIALKPTLYEGNTTTNMKYSDNLQNIFPEFAGSNIDYFLNALDNYNPEF